MLSSPLPVAITGTFLALVIICGIFGNLMVVLVVLKAPRMKAVPYILVANLAIADELQSCNMFFVLVTVCKGGKWEFGETACQIHAFLTSEFVLTSMLNLTVISINRYIKVVHAEKYKKAFALRNLKFLIAFTWLVPLLYAIPPLFGWSRYVYNPGKCTCMFRFSFSHSFAFFLVGTIIAPAMVIIVLCYLRIFWIVRRHRRRVCPKESSRRTQERNMFNDESQITANIAVVVVSHIICFFPATVVNIVELFCQDYAIPFWLDFISFNLIFLSLANNPIVYGLMNKQYRKSLVYIYRGFRTHRQPHKKNMHKGIDVPTPLPADDQQNALELRQFPEVIRGF